MSRDFSDSPIVKVARVFSQLGIKDVEITALVKQSELDQVEASLSAITEFDVEDCGTGEFEINIRLD
jgi:hypothetical protein